MACVRCPVSDKYFWKEDFKQGDKCTNHDVEYELYSEKCPVTEHPRWSYSEPKKI